MSHSEKRITISLEEPAPSASQTIGLYLNNAFVCQQEDEQEEREEEEEENEEDEEEDEVKSKRHPAASKFCNVFCT